MSRISIYIAPSTLTDGDLHKELRNSCRLLLAYARRVDIADVFPNKMTGSEWSMLQRRIRWLDEVLAEAEVRAAKDLLVVKAPHTKATGETP